MKTCFTSLVVLAAAAHSALGWWDNGHLLFAEVASQCLAKDDLTTLNTLLSGYDKEFPNTGYLTTAAIWMDLMKCDSVVSTYCPSDKTPSLKMLDEWHYINLPLNVNGTDFKNLTSKDSDKLVKESKGGQSIEILGKTVVLFNKTQSDHAANFALRLFVHVFGDVHNPAHNVGGVSAEFPNGDSGANMWTFPKGCVASNLHAIWDAAGGKYGNINWNVDFVEGTPNYKELQTNATKLLQKYTLAADDKLGFAALKDVPYVDFMKAMTGKNNDGLFRAAILESYDNAREYAYKGLNFTCTMENGRCVIPCPTQTYVDKVIEIAEKAIAVGGQRMCVTLTQLARQIRALKLSTPATTTVAPTPVA
ncbi:hypothetical protein As57867_005890, partial [Aphanomyces stellatus]